MKSTVELQELRSKDKKDLYKELQDLQKKLTQLRMGQSFRKLKNYHEITATRKKIARLWTILSEKIFEEQVKLDK
ncbi:MAG: 50S ribosomal protein L29 [Patescibacteria group bacterium]|nr:50S ribosomal protein L29 [Patescibacteria group bacterium]